MKKLKGLLVFGACALGLIGSANAATVSIGSDTTSANTKRKVVIELQDSDLDQYKEVRFRLNVSSAYAKVVSVTPEGVTYGFDTSTSTYSFTVGSGLSAKTIGTIEYETSEDLNADFTITPVDVVFVKKEANDDGGYEEVKAPTAKASAGTIKFEKPKSNEAYLTALTVSQGSLTPVFDKDTTEYTVQVKDTISQLRINATPCAGATRTGTGVQTLEMGENSFEIEVTSEDESETKTYTIRIVRGEIAEPSAYLKKLEINNIGVTLSPKFDSKNNKYTITLNKELEKLDFKYETEDPLAKVEIEGNENFEEGENTVTITVTSSDEEDEQTYEITVILDKDAEEQPIDDPKDEEKKKEGNIWLLVGIGIGVVIIVAGVAFMLFKNKAKKKKKQNQVPPIKKRETEEPTVTNDIIEDTSELRKRRETEEIAEEEVEDYRDDKTQQFDQDKLKEYLETRFGDEEDLDKTKEFNFKDFN